MFFVLTIGLGAVWSLAGCSYSVRLIVLFGFGHYLIEKKDISTAIQRAYKYTLLTSVLYCYVSLYWLVFFIFCRKLATHLRLPICKKPKASRFIT